MIIHDRLVASSLDLQEGVGLLDEPAGLAVEFPDGRKLRGADAQAEIDRLGLRPIEGAMDRLEVIAVGIARESRPCPINVLRRGGGGVLGIAAGWLWCEPGAHKPDYVDTFIPIEGSGGWYIYQM